MFSFMEKKKNEQLEDASGRNLRTVVGNDDDSFATRSSRTIGFEDEPKEEGEYTSRNSRSFLDAINFDEDEIDKDITSGGLPEKEVENMTDSERASRFKVAEFAELTDSQRESRVNFLNESLMAEEGTPGLGDGNSDNGETKGLLAQQENLMMEEGITINLLDASDRYQDNFVMIATQKARRKTRCYRYTRIGAVLLCFAAIFTMTFIFVVRFLDDRLRENKLKEQEKDTIYADPSEFFELEPPKQVGGNSGVSAGFTTNQETIYQTIETKDPERPIPHDDFVPYVGPCTDNPFFLHNGEPGQNCDWVEQMDTVARCTRQGVKVNCPSKCDPTCSAPTTFPTESPDGTTTGRLESPSEAPTTFPTSFPTELPTKFDPNALGFRER